MRSKTKEKRFCENCTQAEPFTKQSLRSVLLSKLPKKQPTKLGAAIFALIVLHFLSQFVFFRGEIKTPQIENEQSVEIKTEYKAKMPEEIKMPDADIPKVAKPKIETSAPARKTAVRKKEEQRESRAERLRRAERFLTGA